MRIAYVLSTCARLGPFIVAKDIVNNIYYRVENIDIYYLKESDTKLDFKSRPIKTSIGSFTDFSNYNIVHSHGFLADLYVFYNRKSIRGKWITTMHQNIRPDYSMSHGNLVGFILEKLWCYLVQHSSCVVTLTDEMIEYYRGILVKTNLFRIHNGITPVINDFGVSSEEDQIMSEFRFKYKIMGISANLIYRKGIDQVIRSLVLPEASELALIVIGQGKEEVRLRKLAQTLGVLNRCLFLGFRKNAIDYFKYFDVYVMSSRSESFGLCVIEAAAQKIPVICNDLPVYRELFQEDEVERFNFNDIRSIVIAVNRALKSRHELSKRIYDAYKINYTAERMAENYLKLYYEIS